MVFVGGLSDNSHVVASLTSHFDDNEELGYTVDITTPQLESATTISKGAVLLALHPDWVSGKVLRRSLGFVQDEQYNPRIHTEPEDPDVHPGGKGSTRLLRPFRAG